MTVQLPNHSTSDVGIIGGRRPHQCSCCTACLSIAFISLSQPVPNSPLRDDLYPVNKKGYRHILETGTETKLRFLPPGCS